MRTLSSNARKSSILIPRKYSVTPFATKQFFYEDFFFFNFSYFFSLHLNCHDYLNFSYLTRERGIPVS